MVKAQHLIPGLTVIGFVAMALVPLAVATIHPAESTGSTADHSRFEQLNIRFTSGPEVTRACLECHTEAARQIHQSIHWTWEYDNPQTGQRLGKRHVINNFCLAATPNIASCSLCHIGYGWKDESFDFAAQDKVDCLVCHDTTGSYSKEALRDPEKRKPNLKKIAQKVGATSRRSCGSCHFFGGGGKAVKHGDMDPTLEHPDLFVDVHMDADGLDFSCSTCHTTSSHQTQGSRYTPSATDRGEVQIPGRGNSRTTCRACHGGAPHNGDQRLNQHGRRIACQTCHIPLYARGDYPSKMWWDWSQAGKMDPEGHPYVEVDETGYETYTSKKGDFTWEKDITPEYRWFNGSVRYVLAGDPIDPQTVVAVNTIGGEADDPRSRIWPVKIMRGKQPYDLEHNTLLTPQTSGEQGYWKHFDWASALTLGAKAMATDFSGRFGFVETEMTWFISHMVAPAEEALACDQCHARGGRLSHINDIYIPAMTATPLLDRIGFTLVALTLAGLLLHGGLRILLGLMKSKDPTDHDR